MKYVLSAALFAIGVGVAVQSANLSYRGFEMQYSTIPFAGVCGILIAAMVVLTSMAIPQLRAQKQAVVALAALPVLCALIALDIHGNSLATVGDVRAKQLAYDQAVQAVTVAEAELATIRKDIAKAETDLQTVVGSDVRAAQSVLVSYGKNIAVDGQRGRETNKALAEFGSELRSDLKALKIAEKASSNVLAAGLPAKPADGEQRGAMVMAAAFSLMSFVANLLGSALLGGMPSKDEREQMAEERQQLEADRVALDESVGDLEKVLAHGLSYMLERSQAEEEYIADNVVALKSA